MDLPATQNDLPSILTFVGDYVGTETLRFLLTSGENVQMIVLTRENPETVALAERWGVPLLRFDLDKDVLRQLEGEQFDWLLNLWSSAILPERVLACAKSRLNIHPGLVPVTRGSHCATWSLRLHLKAGVSLLEMSSELDAGDVFAERTVPNGFPMRGAALAENLKQACIDLFVEKWPEIRRGELVPRKQSGTVETFTHAQTVADRLKHMVPGDALHELVSWIQAHDFEPNSTAQIEFQGKRYRITLKLEEIDKVNEAN